MSSVILTSDAPAPIGPYSQAIDTGTLVFCSGQIPLDPALGTLVSGDITAQTRQVMKNIDAVLRAAGLGASHVIKTTIFLIDMADFAAVNAEYGSYFAPNTPARSTVAVAGLPLGSRVEIEVIALRS